MDQIIYSEKIQKKSVYKNKFEQYCEAQRQQVPISPPNQRESQTVHQKFRGASPILQGRQQSSITASQTIRADHLGLDNSQKLQMNRGKSIGGNKVRTKKIFQDHTSNDGPDLYKDLHFVGVSTPATIDVNTQNNQPSREGSKMKQYRMNMMSQRPNATNSIVKIQTQTVRGPKKSFDQSQKFVEHVKVPVHIMTSNANPISYQKNFKEDDTHNYNYNSILINRTSVTQHLSQEPSMSKMKSGGLGRKPFTQRKNKVIMSTTSPNGFGQLTFKDTANTNVNVAMELGIQSADDKSGLNRIAAAGTSQTDTKMSLHMAKVNDSANEVDTTTRSNHNFRTAVLTQNESEFRKRRTNKKASVTFTEKRQRKNEAFVGNNVSQFDNTSVEHMPSVLKTPDNQRMKKPRQIMSTENRRGFRGPPVNLGNSMGYVNYVNGVPVSIQLNERDLLAHDGVVGRLLQNKPMSNWQQNFMLRNRAMQTLDAQRLNMKSGTDMRQSQLNNSLIHRNANQTMMHMQGNQGQYLPSIDQAGSGGLQQKPFKSKNVKPDYYKNRRKANFSNMFEVFDDDTQHGMHMTQTQDYESTVDAKRSMESDDNRTLGTIQVTDAASHKYATEKKRKGYNSDARNTNFNFRKMVQSDGRQSLDQNFQGASKKGMPSRFGSHQSASRSPPGRRTSSKQSRLSSKHNALEEVEKMMPSPEKKLKTANQRSRQQSLNTANKQQNIKSDQMLANEKSPSPKKSKKLDRTASQTKNLLKKAQDRQNADLPRINDQSGVDLNGPLNLQIGQSASNTKQSSPVRRNKSKHWENPSQNVDNSRETRREKLYPGANQHKTFEKMDLLPSLLKIRIMREDLEHLAKDDMDEISKFEVIYKILKDQLRNHQKKLIKLKEIEAREKERLRLEREQEEARRKREAYKSAPKTTIRAVSGYRGNNREEALALLNQSKAKGKDEVKSNSKSIKETVDLKDFVKHIRPFEWYGAQRDLDPELKRIVKNLTCQEHSYVYCPSCKNYEQNDYDPMANIRKFMKFIKAEQDRIQKYQPDRNNQNQKKNENKGIQLAPKDKKDKPDMMPDDSVSEITDLEEEEILAKYYRKKLTIVTEDRPKSQHQRLDSQGSQPDLKGCQQKCKKKRETEEQREKRFLNETIEFELKQPVIGTKMHDEVISAHQFSYRNISVQADSEERLEMEMKASEINRMDQNEEMFEKVKSSRSLRSVNLTPMKEMQRLSNGNLKKEDMLFKPWIQRSEMAIQTDPQTAIASKLKLEAYKSKSQSIEQVPDADENQFDLESDDDVQKQMDQFKEDWCDSIAYKKAMKAEAMKRGLPHQQYEEDEDDEAFADTILQQEGLIMENSQDAGGQDQVGLGFLKKFGEKGNIQMLSEQEVTYVKSLLKMDAERWENQSTLDDVYRHCKFTIRMLTRKMARIDNKQLFRENAVTTRESTLVMVYRAEMLYQAKSDVDRIFRTLAGYDFDKQEFDRRIQRTTQQLTHDDEKFLNKREHNIKRILSQLNNFLSMYKIFNDKFIYKGQDIYDYLHAEIEKIQTIKSLRQQHKRNEIIMMSEENGENSNNRDIVEKPKPKPAAQIVFKPPPLIKGIKSPYNQLAYDPNIGSDRSHHAKQNGIAIKSMEAANPGPIQSQQKKKKKLEWTDNEKI